MTDDNHWKRDPWDDDPSSGDPDREQQRGDEQGDADRTTIRPRNDWEPAPGSPQSGSPQSGSSQSGSSQPSAGNPPAAPSGWEDSSYRQQSWGPATGPAAPGSAGSTPTPEPGSSGNQPPNWQTEPTAGLGDPYSSAEARSAAQSGQWSPSGQQPGYPAGAGQPQPGQYPAGQYPQQGGGFGAPPGGYPPAPPSQPSAPKGPGFLQNLFDLTFTRFVTPTIIKVVYLLVIAVVVIWYLGAIIGGFASGAPGMGIVALLLGWIPALLAIAISRMQLEYIVALIRTSEYSRDLRDHFIEGHGSGGDAEHRD